MFSDDDDEDVDEDSFAEHMTLCKPKYVEGDSYDSIEAIEVT
jgi:hypothetical protein